ncbi:MAG: right-handed parallel beta-helix repeat-containing protein [Armatimonadetes bacterium]|nr:right-handed parallel beta-helix repeat-containing protein [Armatimonadota bacterium]
MRSMDRKTRIDDRKRWSLNLLVAATALAWCAFAGSPALCVSYDHAFEGSCLTFASDTDEVVVPNSGSLELCGEFTLSAWVCPSSLPASGDSKIISKGTGFGAYFLTVGSSYVRGGLISDESPQQFYYAMKNVVLPTDRWTHLAVTYDGAKVRIYVNGVLGGSTDAVGKLAKVTNEALHIGKDFRGKIDQVQIVGRALSAYEVKDDTLRGYWGFEENGGTSASDYSQSANTAQLNGGARFVASGIRGNCLSLDGVDDYAVVGNSGSIQPYDVITVEAWIKPTSLRSNWSPIVAKGSNSTSYWLAVKSGELVGGFYGTDSNLYQATASLSIPTAAWSHIAMTYDGSYVRVFFNGNKVAESIASGKRIRANTEELLIGSRASGENFAGLIDEVCVLSTAKDYNIAGMLTSEGSTASLEYGGYPISNWILLLSNQTVQGRGMDRTVLRLNDNVNKPILINYHSDEGPYSGTPDHDIAIRDITIDGNNANNTGRTYDPQPFPSFPFVDPMGIWLSNNYNYDIERVHVRNTRAYAGICTWPNHAAYRNPGIVIRNYILHCKVDGTGRPATETHGGYGSGIFLSGFDQRNTIVGRTTCRYNAGVGIWTEDYQSYMDVVWNTCTDNTNGGIWLNTTAYSNVLHNLVDNNGGRGILVNGGGPVGEFFGSIYDVVSYNTVRHGNYEGIFFDDNGIPGAYDAYCTFSNNTVEDNNNLHLSDINGITVGNMRRVTIDGNVSRDTRSTKWQYYGIGTQGSADYNTITNNDLRYNRVGGLSVVGGDNVISGNQQ